MAHRYPKEALTARVCGAKATAASTGRGEGLRPRKLFFFPAERRGAAARGAEGFGAMPDASPRPALSWRAGGALGHGP